MISILSQPQEIVFSRNPVWFKFETDNLFETEGQPGKFLLSFPSGPLVEGDSFDLNYSLSEQNFQVAYSPDNSGRQVRSGFGLTLEEWCTQLIEDFATNYEISNNYTLSVDTTGIEAKILLITKKKDAAYNLNIDIQPLVSLQQIDDTITQLRRPNFRIIVDLYIENKDHTAFERAGETQFLDPNDFGQAWWNLSKTLTQVLIADGFEAQNPATPAFQKDTYLCRRYFLRFAEAYGSDQTIQKVFDTDIKWAAFGGVGKVKENINLATEYINEASKLKFLKHQGLELNVKQNQPEWLTLIYLQVPPAVVRLKCDITYTDDTTGSLTLYSRNDIAKYDKLIYPAGCSQLGVHQAELTKVVKKYEVYLEDGDSVVLTEKRVYWLDYRVLLYLDYCIHLSSLGAYDTMVTYGKRSTEYAYATELAERPRSIDFQFKKGEVFEYDSTITDRIAVATGVVSRKELLRFRDFFLSWDKYLVRGNNIIPILLSSKTIRERRDGNTRYALEFEYAPRYSEDLYSEEDYQEVGPIPDLSQYLPAATIADPDNFDDRYYLKSLTYNRTEIDQFFADFLAEMELIHATMQAEIDGIISALNGKADTNHTHPDLVPYTVFNEFADAVSAALIYKGAFDPDYTVDPDDPEELPGYRIGDVVDYKGSLWRSLAGDEATPNTTVPGADPLKWEEILSGLRSKTIVFADFEADLITVNDTSIKTIKTMVARNIGPLIPEVDFTTLVGGGFTINFNGFEANAETAISITYKEY